MSQGREPAGANPWLDLAHAARKSKGKRRIDSRTLVKLLGKILEKDMREAQVMSDKVERALDAQFKENSDGFNKDPNSLKFLPMVVLDMYREFKEYQVRTSLLLSFMLQTSQLMMSNIEEVASGKILAKGLPAKIASQVLKSGAVEQALEKVVSGNLHRSGSKLLPYVN